jgi:hypothetical protein
MFTAAIAALALWVPAPWAAPARVIAHGQAATFSDRTSAWSIDGRKVAQMVSCGCRAGWAIRNLTHGQLIVRYVPT